MSDALTDGDENAVLHLRATVLPVKSSETSSRQGDEAEDGLGGRL